MTYGRRVGRELLDHRGAGVVDRVRWVFADDASLGAANVVSVMAWYFAYATLLSDGTIMVDWNVSARRETCEEVAASTKRITQMLVSACEQFDVPPTVIISGDRKRLTLQR